MTGLQSFDVGLDDVPWPLLRRVIDAVRRRFYTVDWPSDAPALVCVQAPRILERRLRVEEGFEGTQLAYYYEGEVLNLRRPYGLHDGTGEPVELHIRGRPLDDGDRTEVVAHVEYSRYECRQRHVDATYVDWEAGAAVVREILQDSVTAVRE